MSEENVGDLLKNSELRKPMDRSLMGQDKGAVNALVGFLNNPEITGAVVPKGAETRAPNGGTIVSDPMPQQPVRRPLPTPSAPVAVKPITALKFAFTGRLKSGKDYIATAIGAKIFGFAEPLYYLQEYFFASTNKDLHGARAFLQTVGQWGWGCISDKYPLTPARATFTMMVRSLGKAGAFKQADHLCVDWDGFGRNQRIWVDATLARVASFESANPGARIAIVNARFEHEFVPLQDAGFAHYHVMCSPKTWADRLKDAGLSPETPAVSDLSESLARSLDTNVTKQISQKKDGPMLRAIWNDDKAASPSARLYTTALFLKALESQGSVPSAVSLE